MTLNAKIFRKLNSIQEHIERLRSEGKSIVWTNGIFDLLHRGHIMYLSKTASLGDILIVGINSDASTSRLKGPSRPIFDEVSRSEKIAALGFVDYVFIFEEDTPQIPISQLLPQILVKGGDYNVEEIVGYREVTQNGGKVLTIPFLEGYSSTYYINKIKNS